HLVVLIFVAVNFGPTMDVFGPRARFQQPGWFYYAFLNVFLFPWSAIYPWIPHGPKIPINSTYQVLWPTCITLTCFLWGVVWAVRFRWKFGWRPLRFTTRELFLVTAVVAGLLGWFAWISHHG